MATSNGHSEARGRSPESTYSSPTDRDLRSLDLSSETSLSTPPSYGNLEERRPQVPEVPQNAGHYTQIDDPLPDAPCEPRSQDVTCRLSHSVEFQEHHEATMDSAAITAALIGNVGSVRLHICRLAVAVGHGSRVALFLPCIKYSTFETPRSVHIS